MTTLSKYLAVKGPERCILHSEVHQEIRHFIGGLELALVGLSRLVLGLEA